MTDQELSRLTLLQADVEEIAMTASANAEEECAMAFCQFPGTFDQWRTALESLASEAWEFSNELEERIFVR